MKFGVMMFATDYAIPAHELARAVEDSGFESIFFPEHTHIPASRRTRWPGGAELPREYFHTLDPFLALAAAAAVTKTLRLGTGICLVVERDPIVLAKEVASLDHLSGGRVLLGIGGGWNHEEMINHGTNPKTRWRLLRERVLAMREIWTKDEAEFHGEFVNFDPIFSWPKPIQNPLPVLVGGDGPRTFERVVEYGDGWLPIGARMLQGELKERIAELQAMAAAQGRGRMEVSIFGCPPKQKVIEMYAEAGVDRLIMNLPPAPAETVLPALQRNAEAMREFMGATA